MLRRAADNPGDKPPSGILRRPSNNGGEAADDRRGDRPGIRLALPEDHHRGRSRSNSPGHRARPQDQGPRRVPRLPRRARLGQNDEGPDHNRLPHDDDDPVYVGHAVPGGGHPLALQGEPVAYDHPNHDVDWLPPLVAAHPDRVLAPAAQRRPLPELIDLRAADVHPVPRQHHAVAHAPRAQADHDRLRLRMLQDQRREEEDHLRAQEDVNREEEAVRRALMPIPFTQDERDRRQAVDLGVQRDNHRRAQEDMRRANEDLARHQDDEKEMKREVRRKTQIFLRVEKEMARGVEAARRAGHL
ncbi:uncharacterized protein LOC62_01G001504 [Vanrija pseudolonga]|uniref:Uncharacterized protein n=1 Tax=Vanrija pseudolonga TaxID=143232 RepID=A0AAF1BFE4_9TREE|nr:hypothetical protein LOC62_01G001504 [Vanrija pseudolonga]